MSWLYFDEAQGEEQRTVVERAHEVVRVELRLQPDVRGGCISQAAPRDGVCCLLHEQGALAEDKQRVKLAVAQAAGHVVRHLVVASPAVALRYVSRTERDNSIATVATNWHTMS